MSPKTVIALCVATLFCIAVFPASALQCGGVGPSCERYSIQTFFMTNWYGASRFCQYHGMQLASVNSLEDHLELKRQIEALRPALRLGASDHFWLSGNAISANRVFTWGNGRPFTFTNWGPGQPDNSGGSEDCLQLLNNGALNWNDNKCSWTNYFICERIPRPL